jgi:hypothetical protein
MEKPSRTDEEQNAARPDLAPKRSRGVTPKRDFEIPLFPTEAHIARLVLGPGRGGEWKGIAHVLERQGLPKIDHLMGGRYWPAVKVFFDYRAGIGTKAPPPALDGQENWPTSRRTIIPPTG